MSLLIRNEIYEGRFFSDVVDGVKFLNCIFNKVTFPSTLNCEFIDCEFNSCSFPIGGTSFYLEDVKRVPRRIGDNRRSFSRLEFVRCRLVGLVVQGAEVQSCRFLNCKIVAGLDFRDCQFSDYLRFSKCSGVNLVSMDDLCCFSGSYSEQLFSNTQPRFPLDPTWTAIRFMKKLPIPKVGFSVLGATAILTPVFNYISILVFQKINEARSALNLSKIEPLFLSVPVSLAVLFGLLIILMGLSIAHSILEPAKIREHTLATYLTSVRPSEIEFQSLNRSPRSIIYVLLLGYSVVIFAMFFLYIRSAASLIFL
jgi:hypothetical protein